MPKQTGPDLDPGGLTAIKGQNRSLLSLLPSGLRPFVVNQVFPMVITVLVPMKVSGPDSDFVVTSTEAAA
jgi:hypothetical protein